MAYGNTSRTSSKSSSPTANSRGTTSSTNTNTKPIISNSNAMAPGSLPSPAIPASDALQTYPNQPYLPGSDTSLMREAFNRKQFNDTIDTSFSELGIPVVADPSTFDPSLATVGDFFTIYQSLFYSIPKGTGNEDEVNTHEFLIRESTQYTQYIAQQAEINELLEEINLLRDQNLELVEDINTITGQLTEALSNQ
tara:strand:+ start:43 stop:627 length:585 start_codon:yes stop_codon:yes gene_type:complete